jgi:hypothetical protein
MNETPNPTPETLAPLSSVLGFDVIEFWGPNDLNELQCIHYFLNDSVKQVVKRIFADVSDFKPAQSANWRENSIRVSNISHIHMSTLTN